MYQATLEQIQLDKEVQEAGSFDCMHWKFMLIAHACNNIELLGEKMSEEIKGMYGTGEGGIGPFSVKGYLRHHLKDKIWGDGLMLDLMSSCTSLRTTVLNARTGSEHRLRHNRPLNKVDIVLVFNGSIDHGHYSAVVWKDGGSVQSSQTFKTGSGFSPEVDAEEMLLRGGSRMSGVETISTSRLRELERKERLLYEMFATHGVEFPGTDELFEGTARSRKRKYLQAPVLAETPEKVQVVKKGDLECLTCQKKFVSTVELDKHVKKFHEGKIKFRCKECGKGFMTRQGVRQHELVHNKPEEKLVCGLMKEVDGKLVECTKTFGRRSNLNKHVAAFHPKKGAKLTTLKCAFAEKGCQYTTTDKGNKVQHEARCKHNPNRESYDCELCKDKTYHFHILKDLLRHKKEYHGFE